MPFESIACPTCGAEEGIVKVEQDTYRCPNHEGLFKYVEPRSRSTDSGNGFCECGNRVEFRCQACTRNLMCTGCDVMTSAGPIDSPTFGYMTKKNVAGKGVVEGPTLYLGDVLPEFSGASDGSLRHLCRPCLANAVPAAAKAIASAGRCEYPNCGASPEYRCRCCDGAFCTRHGSEASPSFVVGGLVAAIEGKRSFDPGRYMHGLCVTCRIEWSIAIRRELDKIRDSFPAVDNIGAKGIFFKTGKVSSGARKRVESTVLGKLAELERLPGGCSRDLLFKAWNGKYFDGSLFGNSGIADPAVLARRTGVNVMTVLIYSTGPNGSLFGWYGAP